MSEQFREDYQIPWGMPEDIFWDHSEYADLNRLQWIRNNKPELTLEEILHIMPFRDEVIRTFIDEKRMVRVITTQYEEDQKARLESKSRHPAYRRFAREVLDHMPPSPDEPA